MVVGGREVGRAGRYVGGGCRESFGRAAVVWERVAAWVAHRGIRRWSGARGKQHGSEALKGVRGLNALRMKVGCCSFRWME